MGALTRHISAWDGLPLLVREWGSGGSLTPVLCLPGLVRTGEDFAELASALCGERRVVSLDYMGRGGSGRSRDVDRYAAEDCVNDILDVCAALHLHQAIVVGTSFGGLLAMGIATARPTLLRAVVLNDIGPDIGPDGATFVRAFVAADPAFASLTDAAAWLSAHLPPLSLTTDAQWLRMAELTYAQGQDGRFHPTWDTRIARLLDRPTPDLWPLFGALAHVPLLLVHGEVSTVLLPETVRRMQTLRPDMTVVSLPGIGHAPTLSEPSVTEKIVALLKAVG